MEAKYYTPTIEEFHVGFEYESIYQKSDWTKTTLELENTAFFFDNYILDATPIEFRVKYLDREDIESFGWELMSDGNRYWLNSENENKCVSLFHTGILVGEIPKRWIISDTRNMPLGIRFDGNIRNKSELQKLMKMLNIK